MKEKTFKDLGLDEGDKYINKINLDFDLGRLGSLSDILEKKEEKQEIKDEEKKKMEDIKKGV